MQGMAAQMQQQAQNMGQQQMQPQMIQVEVTPEEAEFLQQLRMQQQGAQQQQHSGSFS